jgi:hypothetical protein
LTTLLCEKKYIVAKSKGKKPGSNLADSSKEDYVLNRAVLPMMVMVVKLKSFL